MRLTPKRSTCAIDSNSNSNSDSDNDVEFADINLSCNKLSVHLLANDSMTLTKKRRVLETEDEGDEPSKVKSTRRREHLSSE